MSHWNEKHALSYDEKWGKLEFHQKIPTLAKVKSGDNIVELGCGGGYLALCLVLHAPQINVLAMDPTEKMIALAEQKKQKADLATSELRFVKAGAESLKVQSNSLDLALAAFSVHHWQQPELAMSLIFQALKPGSRIWLCEDMNTPTEGDMQINTSLKTFTGIQDLLQKAGFIGIVQDLYHSHEGEFLIIEATKPSLE